MPPLIVKSLLDDSFADFSKNVVKWLQPKIAKKVAKTWIVYTGKTSFWCVSRERLVESDVQVAQLKEKN